MRIDSHQHYWKIDRGDYHWMDPQNKVLRRDYLPSDLLPHLERHGIAKTVLVQAAQTTAETDFLLDLAADNSSVAGVVGWLDLENPGFPEQFVQFRKCAKFIGMRPMLQDLADDAWILRPSVLESLRMIAEADFPLDFVTYTRHLPFVLRALDRVPSLRAVMDHLSKPSIRTHTLEPWKGLMAEIAQHENVYCKLSGMVTEADHLRWSIDDLRPYAEHVWNCFGADRVMFGSDWPVCLQAGSYDQVIGAVKEILASHLDPNTEEKVFGGNAWKFYNLAAAVA